MSEWIQYKLGEVATDFAMGPFGSNIKAENFIDTGVPVIRGTNLNFDRYVDGSFVYLSEEKADDLKKSNCFPGDLVFTHRGTIGQVGLIPEGQYSRYVISQSGMKLSADNEKINNYFLFYFFKSNIGQYELLKNESQVGVPAISSPLRSLKDVDILLPPLKEQKAIAEVLSSLDDKIDLLHRQNKTLEALAQTLFRQWFVEEAKNEWDEVTVGDFVKTNASTLKKDSLLETIQYLDTSSLTEGKIDTFQQLDLVDAPSRAKRIVKHNDVLISTVRPNQKHYGIIKNPSEDIIVSTGYCVVSCEKINPHFIYILLTTDDMTEYLHSIAEGSTSTYPSLKPADIEAVEFLLPPDDKLQDFSDYADDAWEKIDNNHIQIKTLENMRDTLLPKLMSGEVRIKI